MHAKLDDCKKIIIIMQYTNWRTQKCKKPPIYYSIVNSNSDRNGLREKSSEENSGIIIRVAMLANSIFGRPEYWSMQMNVTHCERFEIYIKVDLPNQNSKTSKLIDTICRKRNILIFFESTL